MDKEEKAVAVGDSLQCDPLETPGLIEHLGDLVYQMISDDPTFCEVVGKHLAGSWKEAELLDYYVKKTVAMINVAFYDR